MRRDSWFSLVGLGCIGVLVLVLVATKPSPNPAPPAPDPQVAASTPGEEERAQPAADERARQEHVRALARMEEERRKRRQAAAGGRLARERLQFQAQNAWSELLATNSEAFLALRKHAAQSPTGQTPCTLCDGQGYLRFCLLCPEAKGQCVTCKGSGKLSREEYCPACSGTGKCFLCAGSGKMLCPFCDDGMISLKWPLPPARLPID